MDRTSGTDGWQVATRDALAAARRKMDTWVRVNATGPNGAFDGTKLRDLVEFAAKECAGEIAVAVRFFDHEHYPERPAVRMYGIEGSADGAPDLWLLGWRDDAPAGAEGTNIHDHDNSRAVVKVLSGHVVEETYDIDPEIWKKHPAMQRFVKRCRILSEGSVAEIDVPDVHRILDVDDGGTAITLHGYYPPLDAMDYYEEKDGVLLHTAHWEEAPSVSEA